MIDRFCVSYRGSTKVHAAHQVGSAGVQITRAFLSAMAKN